ncbi:MAG: phospholipase D-like domain-containing protein [bacterium]
MLIVKTAQEIVTTPTEDWLSKSLETCNSHFIVSSPCVGKTLLRLVKLIPEEISVTLVTCINLYSLSMGASNINSLCQLAEMGVKVKSIDNLYARIYIIDDTKALVTSANATSNGLTKNIECGLATTDSECIKELSELVLSGFGSETALLDLSEDDLKEIKKSLPLLRGTVSRVNDSLQEALYDSVSRHMIDVTNPDGFINSYTGWLRIILEGMLDLKEFFTLEEYYLACREGVKKAYPKNKYWQDDLKRQLQRLRDMGLIEFVRGDKYQKLVTFQGD